MLPEAQGLFPGHSFQGWGVGGGRKPWLFFPRNWWKTDGDFFSLFSFAFVSSQLLPLNLPFHQRVLVSLHPFIFFPSSLPSFPLSPAPVHVHEEHYLLKASLPCCHCQHCHFSLTHPPQQKGSISQFAFCRAWQIQSSCTNNKRSLCPWFWNALGLNLMRFHWSRDWFSLSGFFTVILKFKKFLHPPSELLSFLQSLINCSWVYYRRRSKQI